MISDIIEVIRKHEKKRKEKREKEKNKYWKLPAQERIHYELLRKEIKEDWDIPFFKITISFIYLFFWVIFILAGIKIIFELEVLSMMKILDPIMRFWPILISYGIAIDLFLVMFYSYKRTKYSRKLNERFGLK